MSEEILESTWSDRVANDPKHRPQLMDRPSTTVRKEWCRRPQEAHVADDGKYRRLSVQEIATIQGFSFSWVNVDGVTDNERIAVLGNAVPPPLSVAISNIIKSEIQFENKTLLEICAGIGGLSYGFSDMTAIAKIELWDIAAKVLRNNKPWPAECVVEGYAQEYDYASVCGKVGLLCGGPPCQPWSQAGAQKGAADPRDVMGFTPTAISSCEPEVFLFENVPGLFTASEHKVYVADLLKRMGNPKEGLRYGVATTIVNAADFGVPQVRKRVLILGVKNKSNTYANKLLLKLQASATHHDPKKPSVGKKPWVTLRQAFDGIPVTEPWKKLNLSEESKERLNMPSSYDDEPVINDDVIIPLQGDEDDLRDEATQTSNNAELIKIVSANSVNRIEPVLTGTIELNWPGKNAQLLHKGGKWCFEPKSETKINHSIRYAKSIGESDNLKGCVIIGDYCTGMSSAATLTAGTASMVYFDAPRKSVLVDEAPAGYTDSTWLSIVRETAANSIKSLKSTGVFVLHVDEEMAHYGREVLDEVFGRTHHVTTFAWQKKYAPQNDKTKMNPTDVFDYIIVYSLCSLEDLPKVGILQTPDDIIDDGDWRGCYTAGHKGAKSGSESTKFHVNAPPYHWEIVDSSLPEGKHWFDKITGVLWYETVESSGDYWIKLRVTDSDNNVCESTVPFSISAPQNYDEHFSMPQRVWWLLTNDNDINSNGELSIICEDYKGIEGDAFSIVFKAQGGTPFRMPSDAPGKDRYWEFSLNTLIDSIATATASFGKKGLALPSRKSFHDRDNAQVKQAIMNWLPWQDYGKSEDASRHVKALANASITSGEVVLTAKPQKLLSYLITLFAPKEGSVVIDVGDSNAAFSSVAMKMNRTFVHITGASAQEKVYWNNTGIKRLFAVLNGQDSGDVEKDDKMPTTYEVTPGRIDILEIFKGVLSYNSKTGAVEIFDVSEKEYQDFYAGILGAYRKDNSSNLFCSLSGKKVLVLSSSEILDPSLVSLYSSKYGKDKLIIVSERQESMFETLLPKNVSVIHAPFELVGR